MEVDLGSKNIKGFFNILELPFYELPFHGVIRIILDSGEQIAASAGQAVIDRVMETRGYRQRVNLDDPDVIIRVDVSGEDCMVGIDMVGGESLHRRKWRVYDHPASLKGTIASGLVMFSGWREGEVLLDPMCGGGTIPIEGALMARRIPPAAFRRGQPALLSLPIADEQEFRERLERALGERIDDIFNIVGMDKFRAYLEGARRNARSAGVEDTIRFVQGDATDLASYLRDPPTHVVTNPPYGIRLRLRGLFRLYRGFLSSLASLAPGCRLVLITAARGTFRRAASLAGLEVLEERKILHGDMWASIFTCCV